MHFDDAVDILLGRTKHHVSSLISHCGFTTDEELQHVVASILETLQKPPATTLSERESRAFGHLFSLSSIISLLELRQCSGCVSVDSLPNLILLELSDYCFRYIYTSRSSVFQSCGGKMGEMLRQIRLNACSQLPALSSSFISSISRPQTSLMARLVALRLLYLSVVLAPHIGLELDPTILSLRAPLLQSLVSTLDFLLQDSHILPKEELVVLSIGIVSSIGSIDNLDLLNFRSMSLVLDTVNMVYRKMKMEGNYMMLSTLLDFAPLTAWLVSKAEVVSNLGASRLISQLLSQWLEYHCAREDSWERRITPFLSEHSLAASNYLLQALLEEWKTCLENPLHLAVVIRCFHFLLFSCIASIQEWGNDTGLMDTLMVVYMALDKSQIGAKRDLISCLFILGDQSNTQNIEGTCSSLNPLKQWPYTVSKEILARFESGLCIEFGGNYAGELDIYFLFCLIRGRIIPKDVQDGVRNICQGFFEMVLDSSRIHCDHNSLQAALILNMCNGFEGEELALTRLSWHLRSLKLHRGEIPVGAAFSFAQHILMVDQASFLHRCPQSFITSIFAYLEDVLLLLLQGYYEGHMELDIAGTVSAAAVALLYRANPSTLGWLASSPWTRTLYRELVVQLRKEPRYQNTRIPDLIKGLEQALAGHQTVSLGWEGAKKLRMREIGATCSIFLVE